MENIKELVKDRYGSAIRQAAAKNQESCCGGTTGTAVVQGCGSLPGRQGCCSGPSDDQLEDAVDLISGGLYSDEEVAGMPADLLLATFGCGNPTALAQLNPGEIVLDLGSGAGLDVLLSARRVGPEGKAYGLDMTDEMLEVARGNQAKAGLTNVEFLKGEIENIPLPDQSVDVIISNCVINLSADKDKVLREAFRVLKPGGRFAVSDIVTKGQLPESIRKDLLAWVGCLAGALQEGEYLDKLQAAGFANASIEPTRVYDLTSSEADLLLQGLSVEEREKYNGIVYSGFVRGVKL